MAKKRVSLTLEEDIVDRLDVESSRKQVNRSQLIEGIIENYFQRQGIDTAVILCGDEEAKSLNIVEGRQVLHHILTHLSEKGVRRAILLTGQNREEIKENFGSEFEGVALEYYSGEPNGTAKALLKVKDEVAETFLVLNSHVISDVDFDDMVKVHREEDKLATMALTTVEDPSKYGVVRMKGRQIKGFQEKPSEDEESSKLINAGTYIFEPAIFQKLDKNELNQVFEQLTSEDELTGYIYGGEWTDTDN